MKTLYRTSRRIIIRFLILFLKQLFRPFSIRTTSRVLCSRWCTRGLPGACVNCRRCKNTCSPSPVDRLSYYICSISSDQPELNCGYLNWFGGLFGFGFRLCGRLLGVFWSIAGCTIGSSAWIKGLLKAGRTHPVVALGAEENVADSAHLALFFLLYVHIKVNFILY